MGNRILRYTILCLLSSSILSATFGQSKVGDELYIVSDSDGYVNVRTGAGTKYELAEKIANKTVLRRDESRAIVDGWVPVSDMMFYSSGKGYIHQSRLQAVNKSTAAKLSQYKGYIYALSDGTPDVFVVSDGDCELTVVDLKHDEIVLGTGVPVCFSILPGDTLSFCSLYGMMDGPGILYEGQETLPMFAIYKVYEKKDGHYDYYTDIFPQPRTVSKEKAEAMVASIRRKIVNELKGKGELFYTLPDVYRYCEQLFTAYCSGVDAWDIISNSGCDASICHDLDIADAKKRAYERSKRKPE